MRKIVTALLIFGTIACMGGAVWLVRENTAEIKAREAVVSRLAKEMEPYTAERNEWKEKNKEWKKKLEQTQKGDCCVLIGIDNMDKDLYHTVYTQLARVGLRATFSLKGGHMLEDPEASEKNYIDTEQFREMQEFGWEYAVSADDLKIEDTDSGENEDSEEDVGSSENEDSEETEEIPADYAKRLEKALQNLDVQGIERPKTVFLNTEEGTEEVYDSLQKQGFLMANVIADQKASVIEERSEGLYRIGSVLLYQENLGIESVLNEAVKTGQSLAVSINHVQEIVREAEQNVSQIKFSSFLNKIKTLEEQNLVRVMTYSEFYQYQEQKEADVARIEKKYQKFLDKMWERLAEIDEAEEKLEKEIMGTQ